MQLSSNIRDEARLHNSMLDRVGQSMGGAGDMLKSSATKFNKVSHCSAAFRLSMYKHLYNRLLQSLIILTDHRQQSDEGRQLAEHG
jgi:hypothetical protein